MKKLILAAIILTSVSCKKNTKEKESEKEVLRCGIILRTPTLDSFIFPTYYITALVSYEEGIESVHLKGEVTGDHDGSWFLKKYDKDTLYCTAPLKK